jgi:hypothetical protein
LGSIARACERTVTHAKTAETRSAVSDVTFCPLAESTTANIFARAGSLGERAVVVPMRDSLARLRSPTCVLLLRQQIGNIDKYKPQNDECRWPIDQINPDKESSDTRAEVDVALFGLKEVEEFMKAIDEFQCITHISLKS